MKKIEFIFIDETDDNQTTGAVWESNYFFGLLTHKDYPGGWALLADEGWIMYYREVEEE